ADHFALQDLQSHGITFDPAVLPEVSIDRSQGFPEFGGQGLQLFRQRGQAEGGSLGQRGLEFVVRARPVNLEHVNGPRLVLDAIVEITETHAARRALGQEHPQRQRSHGGEAAKNWFPYEPCHVSFRRYVLVPLLEFRGLPDNTGWRRKVSSHCETGSLPSHHEKFLKA